MDYNNIATTRGEGLGGRIHTVRSTRASSLPQGCGASESGRIKTGSSRKGKAEDPFRTLLGGTPVTVLRLIEPFFLL